MRDGSVKLMQYELKRSKFWVCAAKKSGMPMDDLQAAQAWMKANPQFSSRKVWRK
jgi:hypothetical protein